MGVKHHLLRLARIGPHEKHPAMADALIGWRTAIRMLLGFPGHGAHTGYKRRIAHEVPTGQVGSR